MLHKLRVNNRLFCVRYLNILEFLDPQYKGATDPH